MCGIVGAFPLNKPDLEVDAGLRRYLTFYLHNEVLFHTIKRGEDATGVAVAYGLPDGVESAEDLPEGTSPTLWAAIKQAEATTKFFFNDGSRNAQYKGQKERENIRDFTTAALRVERRFYHILGHTRKGTLGSAMNQLNNHPIMVGNILGIHNGGVENHHKIFNKHKNFKRYGEVDSEAIFQLLAESGNDRALGMEDIKYVQERIEGARAVIAYNHDHPEKVIYWRNSARPIESTYIPELGLLVLYSEKEFMVKALHSYQRLRVMGAHYTTAEGEEIGWPALTTKNKEVTSSHGGVIDMDAEVGEDNPVKTKNVVEVVLPEYKKHTPITITKKDKKENTANAATGFQGKGSQKSTAADNNNSSAELEDNSEYNTPEEGVGATVSVREEEISDDVEDDDIYTIMERSISDLRKEAEDFMFGEGIKDERLLPNRLEKNGEEPSKYIPVEGLKEDQYKEIFHVIYPEAVKDAWSIAAALYFQKGLDEGAEILDEDDTDQDKEIARLRREVASLRSEKNQLTEELADSNGDNRKAAKYIANMKGLIMALIPLYGAAIIKDGEVSFTKEVSDFLQEGPFQKTNLRRVEELFCEKDIEDMKKSFSEDITKKALN